MAQKLHELRELIVSFLRTGPKASSKEIHEGIGEKYGYATLKRALQSLLNDELITATGAGRGTKYSISESTALLIPIDPDEYFQKETDDRKIIPGFNHELIRHQLKSTELFSKDEQRKLNALQKTFKKKISPLSPSEFRKEFERLAIDLSWKSSQIEGNTYSLLETERLLIDRETAAGKTRDEASMLLNHKEALDFILDHPDYVHPLAVSTVENIHSLLIKDLNVAKNIRNRRVGISGTNYVPLDNEHQIRDALYDMCILINSRENVFEKSLLVLALISYIQPFADGNKRTARIISNAILMHYGHCPISFRTVSPLEYKKAMLIFYERNNISALKKIFIEQFEFAVGTYF